MMKIDNESFVLHDSEIKKIVQFTMPLLVQRVLKRRKYLPRGKKIDFRVNVWNTYGEDSLNEYLNSECPIAASFNIDGLKYTITIYEWPLQLTNYPVRESAEYHSRTDMGDYICAFMLSREEYLVRMIAHELRHMWQHVAEKIWDDLDINEKEGLEKHPKPGSDYDADRYAIRKMREWRRLHAVVDIYPEQPDLTGEKVEFSEKRYGNIMQDAIIDAISDRKRRLKRMKRQPARMRRMEEGTKSLK